MRFPKAVKLVILPLLISSLALTSCAAAGSAAPEPAVQTQAESTAEASAAAEKETEAETSAAEAKTETEAETSAAEAKTETGAETSAAEAKTETEAENAIAFEAGIEQVNRHGNLILTVGPASMEEMGYEPADIIRVEIGGQEAEMPVGTDYSNVDSGEMICYYKHNSDGRKDQVVLAVNLGSFVESLGIGEIKSIEQEPGYECVWKDGFDAAAPIRISMVQKQGYAQEYAEHMLISPRTNVRGDYADLSDEDYANFRAVSTTGMGKCTLYRSSSPIDPSRNRNKEADQAMEKAQIRTVLNLTDNQEVMTGYADYALTWYSQCDIIPLNMLMQFDDDDFREKFAEGLRFMISHEGPYLIHCKEGKDRTGFTIAVLECLMGAGADEVVEDYMKSYCNFYKVEPGTDIYSQIADSTVRSLLAKEFEIDSIEDDAADLSKCAEKYLTRIGMTGEEIAALREVLSQDYGGMTAPRLLYQGHGSLRIVTADNKVIYIDPYAGEGYDLPADLILVSHGHPDHNKVELIEKRNEGCKVIYNTDALVNGDYKIFDLGYVIVEAVQAGNNKNHDINVCVGWVLTFPDGVSVYATGDTSRTEQMEELGERDIHYAFFVCDGRFNMDMEEAGACAEAVKARHSIPYHMAPGELFNRERAELFNGPGKMILEAGEEIPLY